MMTEDIIYITYVTKNKIEVWGGGIDPTLRTVI